MTRSPVDAWSLAAIDDDSVPECDAVRRWLRKHNHATNPVFMAERERSEHRPRPLVILARGESGVVGGLFAETEFAWLKISIMAVDPACRSRGIGSALLAAAERQAAQRGCRFAYVDTMEYQAPRELGCCKLTLEVQENNHRARRLYGAAGSPGPSTWPRRAGRCTSPNRSTESLFLHRPEGRRHAKRHRDSVQRICRLGSGDRPRRHAASARR